MMMTVVTDGALWHFTVSVSVFALSCYYTFCADDLASEL